MVELIHNPDQSNRKLLSTEANEVHQRIHTFTGTIPIKIWVRAGDSSRISK